MMGVCERIQGSKDALQKLDVVQIVYNGALWIQPAPQVT